ncbi:MAG: argininosuccinate lyase [Acidobacteria bacterium]|nr:MAG: argininosuccinate lyase [Acidobacteriota bacterium]
MADGKLWGGRFSSKPDPFFSEFNDSFAFDRALLEADIAGSLAWARALVRAGVFTARERRRVEAGLRGILEDHRRNPRRAESSRAEDVHTYVEGELARRVGDLALKLHTGRSRNDQVATDLRLYLRDKAAAIGRQLDGLLRAVARLASRNVAVRLPGYTHLQRAQPVTFGHYLLAFGEMLLRDRQRLREAAARANVCPLGAAALAGTPYRIDRDRLARDLGFESAAANSMDAVSDRDFALDFLHFASLLLLHLSRLAEDLVLYASTEFAFIELDDSVASGSSIMPQKKNPDSLELIRGKAGRVFGHHVALLATLKGLPMTYNKDMQEDKEGLFDAVRTVEGCLRMATLVLDRLRLRPDNMRRATTGGYCNATELADYLAARGLPFRKAHELVGKVVRRAATLGVALEDLPLEEYRRFSNLFEPDLYSALDLERALARRSQRGGTAPAEVRRALRRFRKRISE